MPASSATTRDFYYLLVILGRPRSPMLRNYVKDTIHLTPGYDSQCIGITRQEGVFLARQCHYALFSVEETR